MLRSALASPILSVPLIAAAPLMAVALLIVATGLGCSDRSPTMHPGASRSRSPGGQPAVTPSASPTTSISPSVTSTGSPIRDMDDIFDYRSSTPAHEWQFLVLHHTATNGGSVAALDEGHRKRIDQFGSPWLGVGYHFVIGNGRGMPDGQIEATFRWKQQLHGAHAGSQRHNRDGIGICLVGDFEQSGPTTRQMAAVSRLCEWLMKEHDILPARVLRHSDVAATKCPGQLFPYEDFLRDIKTEAVAAAGEFNTDSF